MASLGPPLASPPATHGEPPLLARPFAEIFKEHFDFVWRSARRLGVPDAQVDDAVQETFLVLYRRREDFEGRASLRTWLFRILMRVASEQRRRYRRKSPQARTGHSPVEIESLAAGTGVRPDRQAHVRQATELLHRLVGELKEERRVIFVLAELEELSMPEIAEILDLNLNTAYARLRAARHDFERAVLREKARQGRRKK